MASDLVRLADMIYLGGERIALNAADATANMPETTEAFCIRANVGDVYYVINGGAAAATSPGYVPKNMVDWQGYIVNLENLHVYGAAGVFAHIQYFKQKV